MVVCHFLKRWYQMTVETCLSKVRRTVRYVPKVLPVQVKFHPPPNSGKGMKKIVYVDRVVMHVFC
jgi:hypothetical protein